MDWSWVSQDRGGIATAVAQHVELSLGAVAVGLVVSVPLALVAWRFRLARSPIVAVAGLLYTVPSIAFFGLLQPLTGFFSATTAEIALSSYTLLILVRNIIAGLDGVTDDVRESARALGYSPSAATVRVYLPLALPSLFAGLRTATVTVIGLVTVAAFVGQGGLGSLITDGFNTNFPTEIIVSLVLSIALAAVADGLIVLLERFALRWNRVAA